MRTNVDRKQIIFRFDDSLAGKLKLYAKRENKSVNSYVEEILSKEIEKREQFPHIELPTVIDPELKQFCGILKGVQITDQDIEDAKFKYLMEK